ncbi:SirB2 family protein [Gallaecimonas sp. GXIMD4217]|uniref:SirB2 family protein n=1 Tax=Gallaecimonas sp. GXIMD4217 TaxID=3131927 RepID=UPI00311B29FB
MESLYLPLKGLHSLAIAASALLLVYRFILDWRGRDWRQSKWLTLVPRANDALLLVSAFGLCFVINQFPFMSPWVTEKLLGLLAYVVLGVVALQNSRSLLMRSFAVAGALGWIVYNAKLAISKTPLVVA